MSENDGAIWIKSDPGADGTYMVSVEVSDDFSFGLTPSEAQHYAMCVLTAVASAEYDAAVAAQMRNINLPAEHIAGTISDLRNDRPPIPWRQAFTLIPGVNEHGAPFLTLHLHDKPIAQWDTTSARSHAVGVLEATIVADMDNAYFRHLRAIIEVDEGRARTVVNDLVNWRQT